MNSESKNETAGMMDTDPAATQNPDPTAAPTATPGSLGSAHPAEGDMWALSHSAFSTLTRRALLGELVNLKGDL